MSAQESLSPCQSKIQNIPMTTTNNPPSSYKVLFISRSQSTLQRRLGHTDGETEAPSGAVTCSRSSSRPVAELGIEPRSPESQSSTPATRQHCLPHVALAVVNFVKTILLQIAVSSNITKGPSYGKNLIFRTIISFPLTPQIINNKKKK
ncbi:hypothetical protein KIL84_002434 [Mauremys mutica]|uniref:Uncharacterized protein n=1 Tax=Mauremys mutica TaxID=74926 RepID=A0A9D3X874_9SAUR|nr:hypothetical protein KIL84_002434 [Mauremys mutica]